MLYSCEVCRLKSDKCTCKIQDLDFCSQCRLEKRICQCSKICPDCDKIILDYQSNCTSTIQYCACNLDYIESLKTKLIDNHDLEIKEKDQTDVTQMLDDQLEKYSIEPITPGQFLSLEHLDRGMQLEINTLCDKYKTAWAVDKFDMGFFKGFAADIPTIPGSTALEKERPMRPHVIREIQPIMENLIREGIFAPADRQ